MPSSLLFQAKFSNFCYDLVLGGGCVYEVGRCLLRYRLKEARMSQQELSEKIKMSKTPPENRRRHVVATDRTDRTDRNQRFN